MVEPVGLASPPLIASITNLVLGILAYLHKLFSLSTIVGWHDHIMQQWYLQVSLDKYGEKNIKYNVSVMCSSPQPRLHDRTNTLLLSRCT